MVLLPQSLLLLSTLFGISMLQAGQTRKLGTARVRKLRHMYICIVTKGDDITVVSMLSCNETG